MDFHEAAAREQGNRLAAGLELLLVEIALRRKGKALVVALSARSVAECIYAFLEAQRFIAGEDIERPQVALKMRGELVG
jgi:hypothetical protein